MKKNLALVPKTGRMTVFYAVNKAGKVASMIWSGIAIVIVHFGCSKYDRDRAFVSPRPSFEVTISEWMGSVKVLLEVTVTSKMQVIREEWNKHNILRKCTVFFWEMMKTWSLKKKNIKGRIQREIKMIRYWGQVKHVR